MPAIELVDLPINPRIRGGSRPCYFMARFIGKSPQGRDFPPLQPSGEEHHVDYLVPNEFICYELARFARVQVPDYFVEKYSGHWHFFTRDIDPRDDGDPRSMNHIACLADDELAKYPPDVIARINAFNIWVLNEEVSQGSRSGLFPANGGIYLMDFACTIFGVQSRTYRSRFDAWRGNSEKARRLLMPPGIENSSEFRQACEALAAIPDYAVSLTFDRACDMGLIDADQRDTGRDFLLERKDKIWDVTRPTNEI